MNNVTVNGVPIGEYIEQEKTAEIQQHRHEEIKALTIRRPKVSKSSIRNSAKTKAGVLVYRDGQLETDIVIGGIIYPWHIKAPFVPSGFSALGGIEYSKTLDKVKCHECGEWKNELGKHIRMHTISAREYRAKHGLGYGRALQTPTASKRYSGRVKRLGLNFGPHGATPESAARARQAKAATAALRTSMGIIGLRGAETTNLIGKCREQLKVKILELSDNLGHVPTIVEMEAAGLHRVTVQAKFGMKLRQVFKSLNLDPPSRSLRGRAQWARLSASDRDAYSKMLHQANHAKRQAGWGT